MDRRTFLKSSALVALPCRELPFPEGASLRVVPGGPDRALVLLELAGGNDGLNTVVPRQNDAYFEARPQLAIRGGTHRLDDALGLHPRMAALHRLFEDGDLAVVVGVGYPQPNRSHFRSMDIWQSGRPDLERPHLGWLGLAADALAARGAEMPALAVGAAEVPLCLAAAKIVVPALRSLREYQVYRDRRAGGRHRGRLETLLRLVRRKESDDDIDRLLKATARQAYEGAEKLKQSVEAYRPKAAYPKHRLGQHLALAARALSAPLGTRIVHLRQGGYDTHAGQLRTHGTLLQEMADALAAFAADMRARKLWGRTIVFAFSEFGRRVEENRSRGTDHGAAGPCFLAGGAVRGGVHGEMPSLMDLARGDLRFTTDFRSIYRAILEEWLEVDAKRILRQEFPRLELLR